MFFEVWLNLIILFRFGILPPNSGKDQKKQKRSLPHFGSFSVRNFGFLVAKGLLLAKKPRGQTYLPPPVSDPRGCHPPAPPQIDASGCGHY